MKRKCFNILIIAAVLSALDAGSETSLARQKKDELADAAQRIGYLMYDASKILNRVESVGVKYDENGLPQTKQDALVLEATARLDWLHSAVDQAIKSFEKAKSADSIEARDVLLKDANIKAATAERIIESLFGPGYVASPVGTALPAGSASTRDSKGADGHPAGAVPPRGTPVTRDTRPSPRTSGRPSMEEIKQHQLNPRPTPRPQSRPSPSSGEKDGRNQKLKPMTGFSSGILFQMGLHDEWLMEVSSNTDPERILDKAVEDFGEGRAGAGGISLHSAATILTDLNMSVVQGVAFEDNRLHLLYGGKKLTFPPLDPEHLALAIRSIYGEEGLIRGRLAAEESNAVVVQTGRDQFGEVVWKKEFLPSPWNNIPIGHLVELVLGPAVGLLSLPEPSVNRVTYYGPIKNTRMGNIMLEADGILVTLLRGIDWNAGMPVPLFKISGCKSRLERSAMRLISGSPGKKGQLESVAEERKGWWWGDVWLVWVPDAISLKLTEDNVGFEFVDVRMKLSVWTVGKKDVSEDYQELSKHATRHYDELATVFPALGDLKEVAKAVAVVRWLKQENIPVDLKWASNYKVEEVDTPARIRNFSVFVVRDDLTGKVLLDK